MNPIRIVAGVAAVVVAGLVLVRCASPRPTDLGLHAGRLAPCPSSPNCVSSQAEPTSDHYVAPLTFEGDAGAAWQRARAAALALPGAALESERGDYLRIEVTTRLLRFVDDLELALDAGAHRIDVRSASRVGHSDLGTNRRRVEALRADFERIR